MANESDRLAHIFIWKQASTTDIEYARQILSVVNPNALQAINDDVSRLRFFTLYGQWPEDPWARALYDMRSAPNPDGMEWTDVTHYDLAGWQGTDQRTGDRLFIVTAYRKSNGPTGETFQVEPVPAPSHSATTPVPQVPYYPQHPTGPLQWPPRTDTTSNLEAQFAAQDSTHETDREEEINPSPRTGDLIDAAAQQESGKAGRSGAPYAAETTRSTGYPPIYNRAVGGEVQAVTGELLPDSYAPYYVNFSQRLLAGLIDFFFAGLFIIAAVWLILALRGDTAVTDFGSWTSAYGPPFLAGLIVFSIYHVVQWAIWGRTLGKYLLGIKVVKADGEQPGPSRALVRMLGYFFSFFGGFLMIAFDPRRQGLHDKLAETYVVPETPRVAVPRGLAGYPAQPYPVQAASSGMNMGMPTRPQSALPRQSIAAANVGSNQAYESVEIGPGTFDSPGSGPISDFRGLYADERGLQTVSVLPELPDDPFSVRPTISFEVEASTDYASSTITGPLPTTGLGRRQGGYVIDRARELYRQGIEQLSNGVQPSARGYKIESGAARLAALAFKGAVELVPNSVLYRYFYGVALRYAEGFELAIGEFRRVLELDPSHFEARQQVAYGPRWHDSFVYTPWQSPIPAEPGGDLPLSLQALLPAGKDPVTRLALLREGTSKVVAVLTRTPRSTWAKPLTPELPAHIDMMLSRTPHGPIIAFYLVVEDKADDPYKGETFLNPHDPGYPTYDACQLGQNLVSQLSRQDHTYLIFVDENNKLLMSRKLEFDPQTQVKINHCIYEIQTLPAQAMDAPRFQQAAQWHMQNFALDQIT